MNASPRILIIRLSALGDILHTLPAFSALRRSFPNAGIEWLASSNSAFLLKAVRGIDKLHIIETSSLLRIQAGAASWRRLLQQVRELRGRRFDMAIDFQGLLKTAILARASGAALRLGFSRDLVREKPAHWFYHRKLDKPPKPVHVSTLNLMLAELAGASPAGFEAEFCITDEDSRSIESRLESAGLKDFIVINPGGGWPTKRWPPGKYGLLAKKIQTELNIPVIVTTGPGEEYLYRGIAESCGTPAPLHFPVPFLQLVPLLKKCRLFIGGDTGPFHLACALARPVVGIFGPTSVTRNGPWRQGEEAVIRRLPCSDCYRRACPTNECMDLTVDEVFAAAIRRLRNA